MRPFITGVYLRSNARHSTQTVSEAILPQASKRALRLDEASYSPSSDDIFWVNFVQLIKLFKSFTCSMRGKGFLTEVTGLFIYITRFRIKNDLRFYRKTNV